MKIIKPGKPQIGWAKEYKCTGYGNGKGGCEAELLVEEADLFKTQSHDMGGDSTTSVTFACCSCGTWTDIPINDVPSRILQKLRLRRR